MKDQVLPILRSAYEDLTKSEKKIADYITGHKDEIMGQTVAEIAKNTANSEITISRFCKKLGFSGLQGLKIALATELSAAGEQSYQDINAILKMDLQPWRIVCTNAILPKIPKFEC